jgi:hypothetical protein
VAQLLDSRQGVFEKLDSQLLSADQPFESGDSSGAAAGRPSRRIDFA